MSPSLLLRRHLKGFDIHRMIQTMLLILICSIIRLFLFHVTIAEFRSYFEHVRSLRFDDRPDYDYLKRLFRELFFRKGFSYDNMFDWEILALQNSATDKMPESKPLSDTGAADTHRTQGDDEERVHSADATTRGGSANTAGHH